MTYSPAIALAFAAGFALAAAAALFAPAGPAPRSQAAVAADPAPWTQHRAGPLLAQESAEMRALRAAGRMALIDARETETDPN